MDRNDVFLLTIKQLFHLIGLLQQGFDRHYHFSHGLKSLIVVIVEAYLSMIVGLIFVSFR